MTQYIVDFIDSATQEQIDSYFSSCGAEVTKTFSKLGKVYCVESDVMPPPCHLIETIVDDSDTPISLLGDPFTVVSDQEYFKIRTDGTFPMMSVSQANEHDWWKYYSLHRPDMDSPSYTFNRKGTGNVVYVVDSGLEDTHPEFANASVQQLYSFNGNFEDKNGHGTAIASVIVGETCGMTNATLKAVKIFDPDQATLQSDLLSALDAVLDDYQAGTYPYGIVNLSWSIAKNTFIEAKIALLVASGLAVVVSAGNSGIEITDVTPAGMSEVVTVGAYNHLLEPSDFSNYVGPSTISVTEDEVNHGPLNCWAPGENIRAATLGGGYGPVAGTSIAAGIHSAALAYNLSDTSGVPLNFDAPQYQILLKFGLSRPDLLDLSDPKYSETQNRVTTFIEQRPEGIDTNPLAGFHKTHPEILLTFQLFTPNDIDSITFTDGLPGNLSITNTGRLYGTTPAITNSQDFQLYSIPMDVTYADGNVEVTEFQLYVLDPEMDLDNVDTGDPELDILLNSVVTCSPVYQCYSIACNDPCPEAAFCFRLPPAEAGCGKGVSGCGCNN